MESKRSGQRDKGSADASVDWDDETVGSTGKGERKVRKERDNAERKRKKAGATKKKEMKSGAPGKDCKGGCSSMKEGQVHLKYGHFFYLQTQLEA